MSEFGISDHPAYGPGIPHFGLPKDFEQGDNVSSALRGPRDCVCTHCGYSGVIEPNEQGWYPCRDCTYVAIPLPLETCAICGAPATHTVVFPTDPQQEKTRSCDEHYVDPEDKSPETRRKVEGWWDDFVRDFNRVHGEPHGRL